MQKDIGCALGVLRNGPAQGRLHDIAAMGIKYVEPQFTPPDAFDAEDDAFIEATIREVRDAGVRVWSIHTPFGTKVDISSTDSEIRQRGIDAVVRAMHGCAKLESRIVIVHLSDGMGEEADPAEKLRIARGSVDELAKIAQSTGVRMAIENLPPGFLGASADELMSVVEDYPQEHVGVCLDTGHANMMGQCVQIARKVAPRIITTHLHDNDGNGDQHNTPGFGTIDWQPIAEALATSPYGGPLMFEVTGPGSREEALSRLTDAAKLLHSSETE
jgi:sugar phosphate isomerase/epimerase